MLCPFSIAFGADVWNEQYTWSYDALADTLINMNMGCESAGSDVLLQLNDFINEHNAELSVKELVDKCVDVAGSKTCGVSGNANIENWTQIVGNQQNEFCDVFVSEFVQNHNAYVEASGVAGSNNSQSYGCPANNAIDKSYECDGKYPHDAYQKNRCYNCINNAGTYEDGRCYVEVIGWACLGKGWNPDSTKNPVPCSESEKYQDCHIVRKYIDVEKTFVCDPASYMPGGKAVLSGCGQHGASAGAKHPPMNIGGTNKAQDCALPLSANTAWRSAYRKGTAIKIIYKGKEIQTSNWCMPSPDAGPWNNKNHQGSGHLSSSSLMSGGKSKSKWLSLD